MRNTCFVSSERKTRMGFVACTKDMRLETVRDAFNDFKIDLRRIGRFHTDRGGDFFKHVDQWLKENSIWHSTPACYDPQANGMTEV